MTIEILVDSVDHLQRREGVHKVRRADRHGAGAGKQELHRVGSIHDSPHADHRNPDRFRRLVDHPDRNRLESRSGKTAGPVGDLRPAGFNVDRHRSQSVDQRHHVAAGPFHGTGKLPDVGDVRTEFGDDRQPGGAPHRVDHLRRQFAVGAESDAAGLDIRTGDVDLQRRDSLLLSLQPGGDLAVFGNGRPPDVHDHRRPGVSQKGEIVFPVQKIFNAGPLQSDRIEHAAGDLRHPGRRIAVRRRHANPLDHHRTELGDVVIPVVFITVTEGAGGGHHRVFQCEFSEIAGKIGHFYCST